MNKKIKYGFIIFLIIVLILVFRQINFSKKIDNFSFTLPEKMGWKYTGNKTISIFSNEQLIGGIAQFKVSDHMWTVTPVSYTVDILSVLQDRGVYPANDPEFDYLHSGSMYADSEIWFGNAQAEYMHYLFFTDSAGYVIWFNEADIETGTKQQILSSIIIG